tara:strand:- start:3669 stop:4886 length:1218 start_codon:yes stop_codon:yes gene_type:complete
MKEAISNTERAAVESITLKGQKVTRQDVIDATRSYDELGKEAFLATGGYSDAVRYHLRLDGRSYPSKAILGSAAGLTSKEFFGGAAHTVAQLAMLGFHVRNSETGEIVDPGLEALRKRVLAEGLNVGEAAWPNPAVQPTAYFASGSNQPGEIRGLARAGADIGVAVPHLSESSLLELEAVKGSEVQVFVDSGAFSEVKFGPEGCTVVKAMGDAQWQNVLGLYERLAAALGSQLYIVAPDRVGCQQTSLERLERYADRVRALRATGVNILVPVQKGELTQVEFAAAVDKVLGFSDWQAALPCKKAATTAAEVAAFVEGRNPEHVHLLGLGIRSRQLEAYLAPFANSRSSVSLDSCWITANVGLTNGPGNGPRRLTKAREAAKKVLGESGGLRVIELAVYTCLKTRS